MMFLTSSFFFVEIIVGYATNSMALVADSFHMLSDIISLFVGFFALKFSRKSNPHTLDANTFGWVRAEVLGALVNSVFLVALCFSILVEALKRLAEPEALTDPLLILVVGGVGLLINLIGMFLFHGHAGHGHSHGGGSHGHSHGGGSHGHSHGGDSHGSGNHGHGHNNKKKHGKKRKNTKKQLRNSNEETTMASYQNKSFHPESDHTTVAITTCHDEKKGDVTIEMYMQTEGSKSIANISEVSSVGSMTTSKRANASGQMNMKGVYLHILGDALGSVIVIVAALLVYFFGEQKWTLYVDPVLSIVMVFIILKTCIPLLKESSLILLQNVPSHIQLKKVEERLLGTFPEIIAVHEFHVWQLTGNKIIASLHIKFSSNADYRHLSPSLKEFFHDEGIHSTTVQPEFAEEDSDVSDDEKKCLLPCVSKSCEEKLCCNTDTQKLLSNEASDIPIIESLTVEDDKTQSRKSNVSQLHSNVELLSVTILKETDSQDKISEK